MKGESVMSYKRNLLYKIFLPLSIGLICIALISISSIYYVKNQYSLHKLSLEKKTIQNVWNNKIKNNKIAFSAILDFIEKDEKIIQYFKAKEREKLYLHSVEIYKQLKEKYNLTHFYFHETNKKNFLRVHNYKKHSDIINRVTLKNSMSTKKEFGGVEFGIFHNLTLRVVRPFIVEGQLIGYLELGEEIDYLTPYLSNIFNAETLVVLDKKYIEESNFKMFKKLHNKIQTYEKTNKYFIINSTIQSVTPELKYEIDYNKKGINTHLNINDIKHNYLSIDIYDVTNQKVGKLITIVDLNTENTILRKSIFITTMIILFITLIMLIFYYQHIKTTDKKLQTLTNEIVNLSITDELTEMYNKRYFNMIFIRELNNAIRSEQYISLLMIDIDNFKKYNDIYGHLKGDKTLNAVARSIKKSLKRKSDLCFRIGGEEFAVLISSCNQENSQKIAQKIINKICDLNIEHQDNHNQKRVTVSIGVFSQIATKDLTVDNIYTCADKALYQAKEEGRNRYIVYE